MKFSLGSELQYTAVRDTTMILNVEVQNIPGQRVVSESFTVTPMIDTEAHQPPETSNRYRRLLLHPGDYTIHYEATVLTEPMFQPAGNIEEVPISELPLGVMNHLFPSRYCESDQLARFAWRRFGDVPSGHGRVDEICDWIYRNVDYVAGASDGSTSAYDTFTTRAGVCRDFAHLGITFCQALGIPARYVSAYAWKLEPQDFHAVFEAYLGGRWYLFDATKLVPPEGVVRIGVGRDAADTAFSTFFGEIRSAPKRVWVDEIGGMLAGDGTNAVSLSAY